MTKDQTRLALESVVQVCYYGATRRTRLTWRLTRHGIKLADANRIISLMLKAKMLEDHNGWRWISATPFLVSVLDNFDSWTKDITWTDDE